MLNNAVATRFSHPLPDPPPLCGGGRFKLSTRPSNFSCKDTEALFRGRQVRRFIAIERIALRKLQQLHAASNLQFLRVPPGNRLEALQGNRAGQYSIRINDQWRICFCWEDGNANHVEIVDYH